MKKILFLLVVLVSINLSAQSFGFREKLHLQINLDEYIEFCYNDSVKAAITKGDRLSDVYGKYEGYIPIHHMDSWYFMEWYRENKILECDCCEKKYYVYLHRQPTLIEFSKWLNK